MSSTKAVPGVSPPDESLAGEKHIPRTVAIQDCSFLFGIVVLSGLSYVGRLGFYSADWDFWRIFYAAKDPSLAGLWHWFWPQYGDLHTRPIQVLYLVLTYFVFGLHPLPYHLLNIVVLAGAVVMFYLALRELPMGRCTTLVVPLVYALLPHYTTDRFWIAAHQTVFSLALFFAGLYAGLRAVRSGRAGSYCLRAASILLFALALLSYEVILPLLPAAFLLIGYRLSLNHREGVGTWRSAALRHGGYFLAAAACLGLVFLFKLRVQDRFTVPDRVQYLTHNARELIWLGTGQAIRFNGLRYGTGLPWAAFMLYRSSGAGAAVAIIAIVIAISILWYLNRALGRSRSGVPGAKGALCLMVAGFAVYALAYVPFVIFDTQFTTTGLKNRLAIGAALGAACILVGVIVLLIRVLVPAPWRRPMFGGAVAILCALNFICVAGIAEYWVKAYRLEREIISEVRRNVSPPAGGTLLLDGFCRQVGPAVVFNAYYDAGGALNIVYADAAMKGDVVSPSLEIGDAGITNPGAEQFYAYGEKLRVYNLERKTVYRLTDSRAARQYFQTVKPGSDGCEADPLLPQPLVPRWSSWRLIFK